MNIIDNVYKIKLVDLKKKSIKPLILSRLLQKYDLNFLAYVLLIILSYFVGIFSMVVISPPRNVRFTSIDFKY